MSLTNGNVVQIKKKNHSGSMNGVHKVIKEFQRLNKFISRKSIYDQYKRKELKCPSKTNKELSKTCLPSATDTEKITTRTEQGIVISLLKK